MLNAIVSHEKLKDKTLAFGLRFWNPGMNSTDLTLSLNTPLLFKTLVGARTNLFITCILAICVFTVVFTACMRSLFWCRSKQSTSINTFIHYSNIYEGCICIVLLVFNQNQGTFWTLDACYFVRTVNDFKKTQTLFVKHFLIEKHFLHGTENWQLPF